MSVLDGLQGPVPILTGHALIGGYPASVLGPLLEDAADEGAFDHLRGREREMVLRTVLAVVQAGHAWHCRSTSDVGSSETAMASAGARSAHDTVSIAEAAALLGVSPRQVRNLAPALGERRGGVWVLDRHLVEAELRRRAEW